MAAVISENYLSGLTADVQQVLDRRAAHFIDGAFQPEERTIPVIDPSSGREISEIARGGEAEIDAAVTAASRALKGSEWSGLGPVERERRMHRLADLIDHHAASLATVETLDNGMPLWFA